MDNIIYIFDGTFFGFLTVVFECFEKKNFECGIQENGIIQESLCFEYKNIETNGAKAERVVSGIKSKISETAFENVYMSFLSFQENRFTDILKYIKLGFKVGKRVDDYKTLDYVLNVIKRRRAVGEEAHLLTGFVRFAETKEKALYSEISPDNDVIEILAEHFADRLRTEKWIINDIKRKKCAVYDSGNLLIMENMDNLKILKSMEEKVWQDLWIDFFKTISIEDRVSFKRQNQMLPKKFRKNMTEFL